MDKAYELLGLTLEQTVIMFSIQYQLTKADIQKTDSPKKEIKEKWLKQWEKVTNLSIKDASPEKKSPHAKIITNLASLLQLISSELIKSSIKTPYYLILLESTLFSSYYPLSGDIKPYKGLKFKSDVSVLEFYAGKMRIDPLYVTNFLKAYKSSIRGISDYWKKVILTGLIGAIIVAITAGAAAPAIGGALGTALSGGTIFGAAAISTGLAALGGGAIAAGGLGIAGGIAVIVGGGAILGGTVGSTTGRLLVQNPTFVMSQNAKLEVVMKEILLTGQSDVRLVQELIKEQRNAIHNLENEVIDLKKNRENNKDRIKNIEKSLTYYKRSADRNEKLL